jgi:prepilin-type N-terminal cleavage/methylation domain-containing protein
MPAMHLHTDKCPATHGFTLAEVVVTIAVAALFAGAAFAANERLLIALKAQKETTAASMMLQERMETFRSISYSNVCDPAYVQTNIVSQAPHSEASLGNLKEQITISGYLLASDGTSSTHVNQWVRKLPTIQRLDTNSTLAANYDLVKVDILLTWAGAGGRTRTRDLSAIFGKGNIGQ